MNEANDNVEDLPVAPANLVAALVKAQAEMNHAVYNDENPHFKSKFANLGAVIDAVKKPLNDAGIAFVQHAHEHSDGVCIETVFYHTSGEKLSTGLVFVPVGKRDAQGMGSAITYAKRYSLAMACGIYAEKDDDANIATSRASTGRNDARGAAIEQMGAKPIAGQDDYAIGMFDALNQKDPVGFLQLHQEMTSQDGGNDAYLLVYDGWTSAKRGLADKYVRDGG